MMPFILTMMILASWPRRPRRSKRSKSTRITRIRSVETTEARYIPTPTAMPMMAVIQIPAAVVRPRTEPFMWIIVPPPMKPMPVITWAAIRPGSPFLRPRYSWGT